MEGTVRHAILSSLIVFALLGSATTSHAQEPPSRLAVDVSGGHSAFADDIPIGHFHARRGRALESDAESQRRT